MTQKASAEKTVRDIRRKTRRRFTAEDIGPIVIRGIRENRLHIFTHPSAAPLAQARFEVIRSDFEAEARAQT